MRVAIMYPDLVRIITMFSRLLSNFFRFLLMIILIKQVLIMAKTSWDVNKHLPIINVVERTSRQIARSKQLNELKRRHRHALYDSSPTRIVGLERPCTRKRQPTSADVPVQFANSVYINFRLLRHLRLPKIVNIRTRLYHIPNEPHLSTAAYNFKFHNTKHQRLHSFAHILVITWVLQICITVLFCISTISVTDS